MQSKSKNEILIRKAELESLYRSNCTLTGKIDPILFPMKYSERADREIAAFIAATLAYGTVEQINGALEKLFANLRPTPSIFLSKLHIRTRAKLPSQVYHRFYTPDDIDALLHALATVYRDYGGLQELYAAVPGDTYQIRLSKFNAVLREAAMSYSKTLTGGLRFMFPEPLKGSTCKRLHLFLRWMVRSDAVDLGLWNCIKSEDLLIPVDTHIRRVALELQLTTRKNPSWKMAEEITMNLKRFDAKDPVRYDFALCHSEILKRQTKVGGN